MDIELGATDEKRSTSVDKRLKVGSEDRRLKTASVISMNRSSSKGQKKEEPIEVVEVSPISPLIETHKSSTPQRIVSLLKGRRNSMIGKIILDLFIFLSII